MFVGKNRRARRGKRACQLNSKLFVAVLDVAVVVNVLRDGNGNGLAPTSTVIIITRYIIYFFPLITDLINSTYILFGLLLFYTYNTYVPK